MFGTLGGVVVPFLFAFVTLPTTLGIVWIFAHFMNMAVYVTNVVTLIGIAIAIDYSMLIVFRYREELARDDDPALALERTMVTAGRATLFSGLTVAIGLALLVLMPLPFMRSMGLGGLMVPLVSIAAAATFLPALLATMKRGVGRFRVIPQRVLDARAQGTGGFWTRLASSIMRHPVRYLVAGTAVMLALAWPVTQIQLTSGDNRGVPSGTEATDGLKLLEARIGAGALAPNQIIVDTDRAGRRLEPADAGRAAPPARRAARRPRGAADLDPGARAGGAGQRTAGCGHSRAARAGQPDRPGLAHDPDPRGRTRRRGHQRRQGARASDPRSLPPERAASPPPTRCCSPVRRPSASTS